MMKPYRITTSSKEIYQKMNLLNFSNSVVLQNVKEHQVDKILINLNKNGSNIEKQRFGNNIMLTRKMPMRLKLYLK